LRKRGSIIWLGDPSARNRGLSLFQLQVMNPMTSK